MDVPLKVCVEERWGLDLVHRGHDHVLWVKVTKSHNGYYGLVPHPLMIISIA